MQVRANGIPIDIPALRTPKVKTIRHNDYNKFDRFATMTGFEDGCNVTAVVPMGHQDFKVLLAQGYKVIDIWDKRNVKEESA